MNNKPKKHVDILSVILSCIVGVIWLFLLYTYLESYAYRYPVISNPSDFALQTLVNLMLPLIPVLLTVCFTIKNKRIGVIVSCVLFIPFMLFSMIYGFAEMLFSPTVHSYTTDPTCLGRYDRQLEQRLNDNPVVCFPSEIPPDAQNVQYCYYYDYSSAETVYIAVSWECEDPVELDVFVQGLNSSSSILSEGTETAYYFTETFYKNAVIIDRKTQQICFVIASQESQLPTHAYDAIPSLSVFDT